MPTSKTISAQPLYQQVRDLLIERISRGVWKPEASLPNEHDLAREFGISPGTLRKALHSLERDGLVMRQRGRGTFVIDQSSGGPSIRFSNIRDGAGMRTLGDMELIAQSIGNANETEQERLRVDGDEPVLRTTRIRHFRGRPFMYEEATIPLSRMPGFDGIGAGAYRISALAQKHGVYLACATEQLSVANAVPQAAQRLMVAPGTPILKLERVIVAMDRHPIEWRIGLCHLGEDQVYLAEMM